MASRISGLGLFCIARRMRIETRWEIAATVYTDARIGEFEECEVEQGRVDYERHARCLADAKRLLLAFKVSH